MPGKQHHRGAHPQDRVLFAPQQWPKLHSAVSDFSWLLSRGYAAKSALQLVGNRYQLAERQRLAVMRSSCSDESLSKRREHEINAQNLRGQTIWLDGYNVLTTIEVALAGGVLLHGRDTCIRDIASLHGTFRKVEETRPALHFIGATLAAAKITEVVWYFDSPVSNSGRLKGVLQEIAAAQNWPWQIELVFNPDPILAQTDAIIATTDSVILDQCRQWFNLNQAVLTQHLPQVEVLDLAGVLCARE